MLYTEKQLNSYATFMLKKHNVLTEHGVPELPTDSDWYNWREENKIQPLQVGQPITITTIDGLSISAEIESITDKNLNDATQNSI